MTMTAALFSERCRRWVGLSLMAGCLLCGGIVFGRSQAQAADAGSTANAATSPASLRVVCDTAAWIGDSLSLKLLYEGNDLHKVLFPILDPQACPDLELFSSAPIYDTAYDKGSGLYTLRAAYPFTIYTAGDYPIPPISIRVLEGTDILIYETDTLWIHILEPDIDPNQAIRDIKNIQPVSFWERAGDFCRRNALWIILSLILLTAAGFGWYYRQRRRKNLPLFSAPEPTVPPLELALNRLAELKEKQLWQQNRLKEYYTELTDILRVFLDGHAQIPAAEMTSDECIDALRQHYADRQDDIRRLASVFRTADLVKFAKDEPQASEHQECFRIVRQFIASHQTAESSAAPTPQTPNDDELV